MHTFTKQHVQYDYNRNGMTRYIYSVLTQQTIYKNQTRVPSYEKYFLQ